MCYLQTYRAFSKDKYYLHAVKKQMRKSYIYKQFIKDSVHLMFIRLNYTFCKVNGGQEKKFSSILNLHTLASACVPARRIKANKTKSQPANLYPYFFPRKNVYVYMYIIQIPIELVFG